MTNRSAITIQYFGPARERTGISSESLSVDDTIDPEEFWHRVLELHPELDALRSSCRLAVDLRYIGDGDAIPPGSDVAIIPPVAGG